MSTELLRATGVESGYGRLQALWGAELALRQGETVVLLGANGAGKTTLLKVLMGLLPAWRGEISFAGKNITSLRADHRVRLGIAYMSEMGVFPSLSVDENIRTGGHLLPRAELNRRTRELYDLFPDLARRPRVAAVTLSGGQRKMLGMAKALAGNPRLLLMDEPSSGLSPLLVQEVIGALDRARREGLSLLIAEQNVEFLGLASRIYTLEGGRTGFGGTVAEMNANSNDTLHRAYFGLK